jgi:hypothetical protein
MTRLKTLARNVVYTLAAMYSWVAYPANVLYQRLRKRK